MPTNTLTAQNLNMPVLKPLAALPDDGMARIGVDHNGNECRIWRWRGTIQKESPIQVIAWHD